MSSPGQQGGPGSREVAYRVFAAEYDDADLEHSDSQEDRAPNYVVTPTGARVNRLFVVGVLTEVDSVSDDVLRARVADPTGAFVLYAGQYQPDAQTFLERAEPPAFVAVTGKARTFQPDGSDQIFTSIRPESINTVEEATRDRWIVQAAEQTCARIEVFTAALESGLQEEQLTEALAAADVNHGLATGIPLALAHYGTTPRYLSRLYDVAVQAVEMVAGDRSDVDRLDIQPDAEGDASRDISPAIELDTTASRDAATAEAVPSETAAQSDGQQEATATASADTQVRDEGTQEAQTESASSAQATPGEDAASEAERSASASDELYELDDDERQQVESEYGTEFNTGNEIDEPSDLESAPAAGEEMPTESSQPAEQPDTSSEGAAMNANAATSDDSDPQGEADPSADSGDQAGASAEPDASSSDADAATDDLDLEAVVLDVMREQDDGDGASRTTVIESIVEEYAVSEADVASAIEDALMSGKCYEPVEDTYKAI